MDSRISSDDVYKDLGSHMVKFVDGCKYFQQVLRFSLLRFSDYEILGKLFERFEMSCILLAAVSL